MRRIASVISIVLGVFLIAVPMSLSLFSKVPVGQKMINAFKPAMSSSGISNIKSQMSTFGAFGNQLQGSALPAIAKQLHMTPIQFQTMMGTNFPAVAKGLQQMPVIGNKFNGFVNLLAKDHSKFEVAATMPVKGVPMTSAPWMFVGLGAIFSIVGLISLLKNSKVGLGVIFGVALIALLGVFTTSMFTKSNDASSVMASLKVPMSAKSVSETKTNLATVNAMGFQFQTQVLPALASQMKMTPLQVQLFLGKNFPAVGKGMADFSTMSKTFNSLVSNMSANVSSYAKASSIPFRSLPWLLTGPALILVVTTGAALSMGSAKESQKVKLVHSPAFELFFI